MTERILVRQRQFDEITTFQQARHVTASEAVCQIFQLNIVKRCPTTVPRDVHLENHYKFYIREKDEGSFVICRKPGTELTERLTANEK